MRGKGAGPCSAFPPVADARMVGKPHPPSEQAHGLEQRASSEAVGCICRLTLMGQATYNVT